MRYSVLILPSVEKEIDRLLAPASEKLEDAIEKLGTEPRPHNCKKLKGRSGWRVRVGDYRIIYEIDDSTRTVVIIRVRHRSEVYR